MTWSEVIGLAVVQGLTEFLPVSSSGHLVLMRYLFGISPVGGVAFDAFLHLGTLGAVLLYYWRTWWQLAQSSGQWFLARTMRKARPVSSDVRFVGLLAVATVPGAVAGYFITEQMLAAVQTPMALIVSFLITAVVLWWTDRRRGRERSLTEMQWREAGLVGVAQAVALVPAISRSAVTIAAGRSLGFSRSAAVTFSFLMSAPIIAGAGLLSLTKLVTAYHISVAQLGVGLVVSFLSGLLAIHLVLKLIERYTLTPFAVYLVGLSLVLWWYAS